MLFRILFFILLQGGFLYGRKHFDVRQQLSLQQQDGGCVPVHTASSTFPQIPRRFFAWNLNPEFIFTVNTKADVELYDNVVRKNAKYGGYTEGVFVFLEQALRSAPKGSVLDIGGNFGLTSIYSAMLGHDVVAFEGNNDTAAFFRYNVLLNCVRHRVQLIESLISDKIEHVAFTGKDRSGGELSGGAYAQKSDEVEVDVLSTQAAKPLDFFLWTMNNRPLLMKVDIEGFEPHAFAGASKLLSTNPPYYIVWECRMSTLSTIDLLEKYNYSFFYLGSMETLPPNNATKRLWKSWQRRPIDLRNIMLSVEKHHDRDGRPGAFDVIAVHKDQQPGCPASKPCVPDTSL